MDNWRVYRQDQQVQKERYIALGALGAILLYLILRYATGLSPSVAQWPLIACLAIGGGALLYDLLKKLLHREFSSDLLAGVSIVTALLLGEHLAGALVVLMLSGGAALEAFAVRRASSVLAALAKRMPLLAHRRTAGGIEDVKVEAINIGDEIVIFPHEVCPVDGQIKEGHTVMDESFLTGEPFLLSKTPGSAVISGAVNGEAAVVINATRQAHDSRYAKIMRVMQESEQRRPSIRRLGDQLGAWYTPLALLVGAATWALTSDPVRFLSVMVIATPCPLLIAIPVAIIGTISLSAKRGIIIRDPRSLEQIEKCRTIILDKTGTLTYGRPELTEIVRLGEIDRAAILRLFASVEQYSKHPLSRAVVERARAEGVPWIEAEQISEKPGEGLSGTVQGRKIQVTGRSKLTAELLAELNQKAPQASGLECVVLIDDKLAALCRFHDEPREESRQFISHLSVQHPFESVILLSGDRDSEVRFFANQVGVRQVYSNKSPEEKLAIVASETAKNRTVYIGDGINDAPALTQATVGIALGQSHEATSEAAGVVIMEPSLEKLDEFFHIGKRMRAIALESAVGGMAVSLLGMILAAFGFLSPVAGAVAQEVIDLGAVLNALRAAYPPRILSDFDLPP
ncbi:MAG: cadmium-translocating P-type ATPase [Oligoflexia bacterium]|nr:cadmium-translocating P-type ATPase [Oligoflexia bacterium]